MHVAPTRVASLLAGRNADVQTTDDGKSASRRIHRAHGIAKKSTRTTGHTPRHGQYLNPSALTFTALVTSLPA
jgi:hypothetical protein